MPNETAMATHARLTNAAWQRISSSQVLLGKWASLKANDNSPSSVANDGFAPLKPRGSIVLSLRDGHVWASWGDDTYLVDLGSADEVDEMMRNYLDQTEAAERLMAHVQIDSR